MKMFLTPHGLFSFNLFRHKTEGQMIWTENLPEELQQAGLGL